MVFFSLNKKILLFGFLILFLLLLSGLFLFSKEEVIENWPEPIVEDEPDPQKEILGFSVNNLPIEAYTFGTGPKELLFVGGIHGGYEWNSTLLAYEFINYFTKFPENVPADFSLTIIPSANPDGLFQVTGKAGPFGIDDLINENRETGLGRFNANGVDLNRNFDCRWQPESTWKNQKVSAGNKAFSEPESLALKNFIEKHNFVAAIFWHSQANAVYASECLEGILPETLGIMKAYAGASGYRPVETFDAYTITGDAEGWLASIGIPAITVELQSYQTLEWEKNLAGVTALLKYYQQ